MSYDFDFGLFNMDDFLDEGDEEFGRLSPPAFAGYGRLSAHDDASRRRARSFPQGGRGSHEQRQPPRCRCASAIRRCRNQSWRTCTPSAWRWSWGVSCACRTAPPTSWVRAGGGSEILGFNQTQPYIRARIQPLPESRKVTLGTEALMRAVLSLFEKVVQLSHTLPEDAYVAAMNVSEPGPLADLIASLLDLDFARSARSCSRSSSPPRACSG